MFQVNLMDCDKLRENYKKCFMEFGIRQCRPDLDELYKCLYENEMYLKPTYSRKPPIHY